MYFVEREKDIYISRRFSTILLEKAKVKGSKHRWFENEARKKKKYETSFSISMAADGRKRIRTKERFLLTKKKRTLLLFFI
jgi:hypothetical protein